MMCKNYGFIQYLDESCARKAIEAENGTTIAGVRIVTSMSNNKAPKKDTSSNPPFLSGNKRPFLDGDSSSRWNPDQEFPHPPEYARFSDSDRMEDFRRFPHEFSNGDFEHSRREGMPPRYTEEEPPPKFFRPYSDLPIPAAVLRIHPPDDMNDVRHFPSAAERRAWP